MNVSKSLSLQSISLILEGTKNRMGLSQVNKVDGPFFVMDFLARGTREILTHHAQGYCHGGESDCQARVRVFPPNRFPQPSSAISLAPNLLFECTKVHTKTKKKANSMVRVRERTIPIELPPLVGEVIANFCG
jgi:hypothetical protein